MDATKKKPMSLKLPTLVRSVPIESVRVLDRAEGAPDNAPTVYRFTVSSETPVMRWFGEEILSHDKSAVDLSRAKQGVSVRDDHWGDQVGLATNPAIEDRQVAMDVIFSRNDRPQEIERDVAAGIRRFVSIRYNPTRAKRTEAATYGPDGETLTPDRWTITRWQLIHVAFTPDAADVSVGPGRSQTEGEERSVEIEGGLPAEEDRSMCTKCNAAPCACAPAVRQDATPAAADRNAGGGGGAPAAVIEVGIDHSKRSADILRLCDEHGFGDRAQMTSWIEKGTPIDTVVRSILDSKRTVGGSQPASERLEVDKKDAGRYSYRRAILSAVRALEGEEPDGVEGEYHRALLKKLPQGYAHKGGILMPMRLLDEPEMGMPRARATSRALDSKTSAAGAEAVFDQPSNEVIELLRNKAISASLGTRIMAGLTAPVPFLKQTGAASAFWVGENPSANVASSNPTTGIVNLTPKTLQANVPYSRQFLAIASIDVESWVRDDLAQVHALQIDRTVFHGLGSGGEPVGIYLADAVQTFAFSGNPTYANVVDVTGKVADKNALRGSLGWAITPLLAAAMKRTPVASGFAAGFVWDGPVDEGEVAGYRALSSSQLSKVLGAGANEHGIIFGNWAEAIIGMWGAMEVIVDPYALKKTGMIEITTFQLADNMLRHGESFVKGTGAIPT